MIVGVRKNWPLRKSGLPMLASLCYNGSKRETTHRAGGVLNMCGCRCCGIDSSGLLQYVRESIVCLLNKRCTAKRVRWARCIGRCVTVVLHTTEYIRRGKSISNMQHRCLVLCFIRENVIPQPQVRKRQGLAFLLWKGLRCGRLQLCSVIQHSSLFFFQRIISAKLPETFSLGIQPVLSTFPGTWTSRHW